METVPFQQAKQASLCMDICICGGVFNFISGCYVIGCWVLFVSGGNTFEINQASNLFGWVEGGVRLFLCNKQS